MAGHVRLCGRLAVLTAALCVVGFQPCRGQVFVGFSAGPQLSSVKMEFTGGERPKVDLVLGFHVGVMLGYDYGPFAIRSGLNYVNAGALFNDNGFFDRNEFDVNFVTVPVDLRFWLTREGRVRPYLFVGPEFRYALSLEDSNLSLKEDLRLLDATFAAGLGISLRVKYVPFRFSPEIRYAADLTGIYDGEIATDDGGLLQTARAVRANTIRLGVLIGL